jgi:hypothetical protein
MRYAIALALITVALCAGSLPTDATVTVKSSKHNAPAGVVPLTMAQKAAFTAKLAARLRALGQTAKAGAIQARAQRMAKIAGITLGASLAVSTQHPIRDPQPAPPSGPSLDETLSWLSGNVSALGNYDHTDKNYNNRSTIQFANDGCLTHWIIEQRQTSVNNPDGMYRYARVTDDVPLQLVDVNKTYASTYTVAIVLKTNVAERTEWNYRNLSDNSAAILCKSGPNRCAPDEVQTDSEDTDTVMLKFVDESATTRVLAALKVAATQCSKQSSF